MKTYTVFVNGEDNGSLTVKTTREAIEVISVADSDEWFVYHAKRIDLVTEDGQRVSYHDVEFYCEDSSLYYSKKNGG